MSDYTMQASSGQPTIMVRKVNGEIVTQEANRDEWGVPPKGEYRWRIIGFAEPFDMTFQTSEGAKTQKSTRLELQAVLSDGRLGAKTTALCSWTIGPKSHLGKVYGAVAGVAVEPGNTYDALHLLGGEFVAYGKPGDKLDELGKPKYFDLSWVTVCGVAPPPNGAADGGEDIWS